jgi:hypothetical protein
MRAPGIAEKLVLDQHEQMNVHITYNHFYFSFMKRRYCPNAIEKQSGSRETPCRGQDKTMGTFDGKFGKNYR